MRAPAFWWRRPGIAAALLAPAAFAYGAVARRRLGRPGASAPVPVICVGNVTVGGSGKTPTALAVAGLLREAGRHPAFLTRGHGGSLAGPVLVEPARHGSPEVGDEALLLARLAPTAVSRDRVAGARLAADQGADVIVMDDGLQNPSLRKDLAVAVFDGAVGIGNGRVLPAGPLRAPLAGQWPLIDAVLVVGQGLPGDRVARQAEARGFPALRARLEPDAATVDRLEGRPLLAFAGIGRPEKFFETCRAAGLAVARAVPFADHHPYRPDEIAALLDHAEGSGLVPVTTEKDRIRLDALAASESRLSLVQTLPARLVFEAPETIG